MGPHIDVTAPYLEGKGAQLIQMRQLSGPEEAKQFVDYWASVGATSFKAYMHVTRAELRAAIDAAHKHGLKMTAHLCSVTYPEAAAMGIDNLEHGFFVNTQLDSNKKPDECSESAGEETLKTMDPEGPEAARLFGLLVAHHVAITSTLPVAEAGVPNRPPLQQRFLDVLSAPSRTDYLMARAYAGERGDASGARLKREMDFEYQFVKAGGNLLAGLDPTGNGGVVAGFGDQREVELLVEAGFSPAEAIHISTENGAKFLGEENHIGTLKPGRQADIVVLKGDPIKDINEIEKVEIVFKDGKGYDPQKLIKSVMGTVGLR